MKDALRSLIAGSLVLGGAIFFGTVALERTAFAQFQTDSQGGQQPAAQPTAQQPAQPAAAKQPPMTEKEVVQLVKKNKKNLQAIISDITNRGVAFEMTAEIQDQLTKAGATPEFISNLKNLGPTARSQMAAATAGKPTVPGEEMTAFQAIQNELDPDRKVQEVNDFAGKYPNSALLTYAYFLAQGGRGRPVSDARRERTRRVVTARVPSRRAPSPRIWQY